MSSIEPVRRTATPSTSPMPLSRAWREERQAVANFVSKEIAHRDAVADVQRTGEINQERATAAGNLVARNAQIVDRLGQFREQVFAESGDSLRSKDVDDIVAQGVQQMAALQARSIQRLG
ncbi:MULTISPECIES: hypothetical protein [unclassified Nocardioides]|uniref:hypothetical protein n=1 Tax=unclassified Nocardioides TaxID=2615069 RepID=UPI0030147EDD